MKFKFNDRQYQTDAIEAVTDIFEGLAPRESTFTIFASDNTLDDKEFNTGYSNSLNLSNNKMLDNIQKIQSKYGLIPTDIFDKNVNIEMETGTGKTYVYLNTICKLYSDYGLKKFIILVPGIAIKEGVYKSFTMLEDYLKTKYAINVMNCDILNTSNLNRVHAFGNSKDLEIMIMNIDSFNKDSNILNKASEDFKGGIPIETIQKANPILIIDEPQNVKSDKSKEAIKNLNPAFIARYSATHVEKFPCVFKLSPIDAYNKNLVKKYQLKQLPQSAILMKLILN